MYKKRQIRAIPEMNPLWHYKNSGSTKALLCGISLCNLIFFFFLRQEDLKETLKPVGFS